MKKIFSFTKKNKFSSSSSSLNQDSGSVQSAHGYELKEKDLGKVHKAASVGDVSKLKQLVKKNDVNQPDKENRTALHIACANGHVEVVHFLVESKAKLNLCDSQNRSALMKAVQCQHERCVSILLENHADPNLADTNGDTALHMAAAIPSISSAALLLEHRAAVDTQNKEGASPLTTAVRKSHVEMAEFLLKDGADVNVKDQDQRTPLMLAAGNGHTCMVRLLLQFDADITLQDASGCTADSHAVRNQHHACSLLIIEHGTKKNIMLSPSHQLPSKSPLRGGDATFSLGGPATDKDEHESNQAGRDAEDNSQSESVSRASKSAVDDWPSSEDEDELDLTPEKPQKVNLKKLIASKKGENADSGTEPAGNNDTSQQPSTSKGRPDSPEGSPEGSEDGEEEEDDDDEDDESEDDDDEDGEDDDDYSDEDSEDEDEAEDEEDDDEEQESEEELGDNAAVCVPEKNNGMDLQNPPDGGIAEVSGRDVQNEPTGTSDCTAAGAALVSTAKNIEAQDNTKSTEGTNNETVITAGTSSIGLPVTLDLEDGFIVSAIRVEAKFSDEDDSLGKVHAGDFDKEVDDDLPEDDDRGIDSGSDEPDQGDTIWNDSDDDVEIDQKVASGRSTVLARRIRVIAGGEREDISGGSLTPKDDDKGSHDNLSKAGTRRSSWGSSLDESDDDNHVSPSEKNDRKGDTFAQDGQGSVELPGPTTPPHSKRILPEPHPDKMESPWDFSQSMGSRSKSVSPKPKLDTPPRILQTRNGSAPKQKVVESESQWDSSSSDSNPKDGAFTTKGGVYGIASAEDKKLSEEQHISDDSWEDDNGEDVSPALSPEPEAENTTAQVESNGKDVESIDTSAKKEGKSDEEKVDDNSWDNDDDEEEPAQNETSRHPAASSAHGHISAGVSSLLHKKKEQKKEDSDISELENDDKEEEDDHVPVSVICGDEDLSEDDIQNEKGLASDKEKTEDSDSQDQKLRYDFVSGTVKVLDAGEDSDNTLDECLGEEDKGRKSGHEDEPRLTAFVSLSLKDDMVSGGLDTEPVKQANCDGSSDEELPHTDIDKVDLEDRDKERTEFRSTKEADKQKEDSTEDDDDEEEEDNYRDEEDEGDDEDDREHSEGEDGDSPVTSTPGPENEISKDKQRDFLSELGLEKGEEEEDSWDSESRSESPQKTQHDAEKSSAIKYPMSVVQEENKEVVTDDVGRDSDSSGKDGDVNDDHVPPKETEKAKWEPLSVLNKLEGTCKGKTDLMEELGLGDVDDLEARKPDASDWDSASTTSRRTLPGRRMASSPGVEELPESSSPSPPGVEMLPESSSPSPVPLPSGQEQEAAADTVPAPPTVHGSGQRLTAPPLPGPRSLASPSRALPNPQPRARKMAPQKPESEEDSDWDSDSTTSPPRPAKTCNQLPNISETQVVKSGSPVHEPLPVSKDREIILQAEEHIPKAGKESKTKAEAQKPSASWDVGPKEEGLEAEKPETVSRQAAGSVAGGDGATEMEQQLTATDSNAQILATRNPKRSPSAAKGRDENPGDMELAEDFDELTQSSDTATDDSPTSGYHHASLLVQQLDSTTLDSRSMVKLQNMFLEYERSIQKARSRHGHLTDKVRQLEMEKAELKTTMEDIKEDKSALERHQLELKTDVNNLKYQLKQEQENHRNASMMYNSLREKLKRTEEQQQLEVEEKQRVELTLRNLELDMRTLHNNMKQLEEDLRESQRLLAQERSARTMQENLLSTHLRKQQEIEEENRRNVSKSNEALSQLTEASDREKELLQQNSSLQEELGLLRLELERCRANSAMEESRLAEESEAVKERLEDARRDLKLNEEALAQTVFQYNSQLTALKSEASAGAARLEHERQARETLETEVESMRNRLTGALQEAERCQAARTDAEKALLREREEHQRIKDKHTGDAAGQRETFNSLSGKLSKSEARANSLENEVHRATLQLTEKGLLLEALQREKDQVAARAKELEMALQAEREVASRTGARQEATQERLAAAQSEGMLLRQQLEEAQNKGVAKERAVTDAQERFSDILDKLRADCEERVTLVEERSKELAGKAADLRDQVHKLEEEKNDRESSVRQLQQELADSLKKLSMSEASLEVNTRYRNDLEDEKTRLLKDLDRLKDKVQEGEDQYVQAERRINAMKSSLDDKDRELCTTAQRLQEALSASAATDATTKQLEEAVQRLEIENARLEAAAKQQSNKIEALQKEAQEAAMVQKQSMLSHTAQDSQALWEEELKSRSKLGLRLAELEKEKGELGSQMEIEKKKVKKIAEQKKAVDSRLEQEMKRNTDLQKEMYRLRTLLKTAKKKYREHEGGGAEFGSSPMSSMRMDPGRYSQTDGAVGRMKEQVDDLQTQLGRETSRSRELDKLNAELQQQLSSMKGLSRSNERLEKANRQLEDELTGLRRQAEAGMLDPGQAEQYRRDAEDRARLEIRQKLEEVNLFLQTQAASQEALDQLKSANESNVRSGLEQRIRELETELSRTRSTQQDSLSQRDSTRTELERYRQLYADELRTRKSLAAKLERSNTRLSDANAKLLNERHRTKSLFSSSLGVGGPPQLDMSCLGGSPTGYGASLGPLNRSLGLGLPLLSPMSEGHNSSVEDYLARMRSELERNISRELAQGKAELEGSPTRMSPVGSACGVELDPVSRATQDYLEVLKKNYMI